MQRNIFIYGLVVLAVLLFAVRMWVVNLPEPMTSSNVRVHPLAIDAQRLTEIRGNEPGWKAIGRGPITIEARGTIDIGGMETSPDDEKRPGDEKALVPTLPYGMLVGKIGENGTPFRIGKRAQVAMKENVYIAINDADHSDNSGSYTIKLTGGTKY